MPFNGNGILEKVANTLPNTKMAPIEVDDRSCIDMPEYVNLTCNCWFVDVAACPVDAPEFCRQCTKVGGGECLKFLPHLNRGPAAARLPAAAAGGLTPPPSRCRTGQSPSDLAPIAPRRCVWRWPVCIRRMQSPAHVAVHGGTPCDRQPPEQAASSQPPPALHNAPLQHTRAPPCHHT